MVLLSAYISIHILLIFGTNTDIVNITKKFLASNFYMKDMGEANINLGNNIS